jgi:hypothetical protein
LGFHGFHHEHWFFFLSIFLFSTRKPRDLTMI